MNKIVLVMEPPPTYLLDPPAAWITTASQQLGAEQDSLHCACANSLDS